MAIRERRLAMVLMTGLCAATGSSRAVAQTPAPPVAAWPADIDPQSGFRLPLPNREDLNEEAKKTYDRGATPGANIAGLQGPSGVQLYSPRTNAPLAALLKYLRQEAGLGSRAREIALITTSREMDSQFEFTAHEPEAVKAGVPPETIDAIKFRGPTSSLDEKDAVIIDLGRQIWRDHKVTSDTFKKARAIFGDRGLVDLVLLMGSHAQTAALLTAFDMQLHKGDKPLLPMP